MVLSPHPFTRHEQFKNDGEQITKQIKSMHVHVYRVNRSLVLYQYPNPQKIFYMYDDLESALPSAVMMNKAVLETSKGLSEDHHALRKFAKHLRDTSRNPAPPVPHALI